MQRHAAALLNDARSYQHLGGADRAADRGSRRGGSGWGSEAVHQDVEKATCPGTVVGLGGHGEDVDEAGSDVFGGDVGAELARRTAGAQDFVDGREQLALGLGVGDLPRFDHRDERVEHAGLGGDPVPEQVHPAPQAGKAWRGARGRRRCAHHTPDGVDDRTAATLAIAGCTAAAALAVVNPGRGDTLLIGGAGGGVGVFAVQLARLAGARVIGTGSAASADALRVLGAEPVAYGDGLVDRRRALAPTGVTAAIDLHGTETVRAARELGVRDDRIATIAAQVDGVTPANGANAAPGAIEEIARLVAAGQLRVPIAATFPVEQIGAAVDLQAGRHVYGKVVIDL